MAKVMTVQEALDSMRGKRIVDEKTGKEKVQYNRFSKKNFNALMTAMANDEGFVFKVAKTKAGEISDLEDIMVTKKFRKWCKALVEKAGVDKAESEKVLSPDFVIDNVDGLYEFFTAALYSYMEAGNAFDMPLTEDCKASFKMIDIPETTTVKEAYSPQDRSYLGTYETRKKKHKQIHVSSSCPDFLKTRKRVDQ